MNKKSKVLLLVLIVVLAISSCSKNDAMEDSVSYDTDVQKSAPMPMAETEAMYYGDEEEGSTNSSEVVDYSEKIIYNINMGVVVDDPIAISKEITKKVNAVGGYVSSSYSNKNEDKSSYVNMQVRVPSKGLNSVTDFISSISDVEYENMSTNNVTDSYYDTKARLEHEKLQAKQLEEIMAQAKTIKDTLTVREELSRIQEVIEVYEGRIRMWDNLVDYSTIDISISPTPTIDNNNSSLIRIITLGETGRAIGRAFRNSWAFVANFFSWLFRVIAALIIPALIVVPITIAIVKLSKNSKAKKKENQDK